MLDKLDDKSDKCYFVGYPKETKGYYFYHPLEQKVFVSRHVVFLEKELLKENSGSRIELEEVEPPQNEDQLNDPKDVIHDEITLEHPQP